MSNYIHPTTGQSIPSNNEAYGDTGQNPISAKTFVKGDPVSGGGAGLMVGEQTAIGRMFEDPANFGDPNEPFVFQDKFIIKQSNPSENRVSIIYEGTTPNTYKTISGSGVTDDGDNIIISSIPSTTESDTGKKLVVKNGITGELDWEASTTSSGFYELPDDVLTWNETTKVLAFVGEHKFVTDDGSEYTKTDDSITVTSTSTVMYIYYDNDGILKEIPAASVETQRDTMLTTLPVAYVIFNDIGVTATVSDYRKGRVSSGLWVKNFYDKPVYILNGVVYSGLTGGNGNSDADIQFSLSAGNIMFTDKKLPIPTRATTDPWIVNYFNGASGSSQYSIFDHPYLILTDNDLGVGTTGRALRNNNGNPIAVTSGRYVWYFVGVNLDIHNNHRTFSFMGNGEYINIANAENALNEEVSTIEVTMLQKQGAELVYAVLIETNNSYSNAVKSRIEEIQVISRDSSSYLPSVSLPPEIVNGSDISNTYHNHKTYNDTLYLAIDGSNANQDVDLGVYGISANGVSSTGDIICSKPLSVGEVIIGTNSASSANPTQDFYRWAGAGTIAFGSRLIQDSDTFRLQCAPATEIGSHVFESAISYNCSGVTIDKATIFNGNIDLNQQDILDVDLLEANTSLIGNTQVGTWSQNSLYSRVGHKNFNLATNYGFLQSNAGSVFLGANNIYLNAETEIICNAPITAPTITATTRYTPETRIVMNTDKTLTKDDMGSDIVLDVDGNANNTLYLPTLSTVLGLRVSVRVDIDGSNNGWALLNSGTDFFVFVEGNSYNNTNQLTIRDIYDDYYYVELLATTNGWLLINSLEGPSPS